MGIFLKLLTVLLVSCFLLGTNARPYQPTNSYLPSYESEIDRETEQTFGGGTVSSKNDDNIRGEIEHVFGSSSLSSKNDEHSLLGSTGEVTSGFSNAQSSGVGGSVGKGSYEAGDGDLETAEDIGKAAGSNIESEGSVGQLSLTGFSGDKEGGYAGIFGHKDDSESDESKSEESSEEQKEEFVGTMEQGVDSESDSDIEDYESDESEESEESSKQKEGYLGGKVGSKSSEESSEETDKSKSSEERSVETDGANDRTNGRATGIKTGIEITGVTDETNGSRINTNDEKIGGSNVALSGSENGEFLGRGGDSNYGEALKSKRGRIVGDSDSVGDF